MIISLYDKVDCGSRIRVAARDYVAHVAHSFSLSCKHFPLLRNLGAYRLYRYPLHGAELRQTLVINRVVDYDRLRRLDSLRWEKTQIFADL